MKRILLLIALALLLGCSGRKTHKEDTGIRIERTSGTVKIVEIDSCEYLYFTDFYAGALAHKGNCKYCTERND